MYQPFKHELHTFPSGLRLVTVPMPSSKTATVFVLVGTGSVYETKDINGISHFLEHMMFKGTEKRPGSLDISKELDSIGASYNAFTSKEYTGYYAKVSLEKLDVAMDVVFDIFLNSKFPDKEIEVERGVVVQEMKMYNDLPQAQVGHLFEELLYGDQPAGWKTVGTEEAVMALDRDKVINYFETHYVAENTVVGVAGDIDSAKVREGVEEYFKTIRHEKKLNKTPTKESQSKVASKVINKKTDQTHLILGVRTFSMFDEKRYPASVLSKVLGGGMSSRLFSEVREKRGLAYYVGADTTNYTDSGYLEISAGVSDQKAHEAVKVIMDELGKLKAEGISEDELKAAKDNAEGSIALGLERTDRVAMSYAGPVLFYGRVLTPEEELAKIKAVTLDEVNALAKEIFTNNKLNLALVGPFEDSSKFGDILTL